MMYAANTGDVRFVLRLLEIPDMDVNIENQVLLIKHRLN